MPKNSNAPNLSDNFYIKLSEMCNRLNLDPEDMLLVMYQESGLNPHIESKASGLTQFIGDTLKEHFKGSPEEFKQLSGEEQLPYIEKYFQSIINAYGLKNPSPAQFYIANLLPATLSYQGIKSKDKSTVIAKRNDDTPYVNGGNLTFGKAYKANRGLDKNNNGEITYGDIVDFLNDKAKDSYYQNAVTKFHQATGSPYIKKELSENEGGEDFSSAFSSFINNLIKKLKEYTKEISSSSNQFFLIKIASPNLENNLEFARIFSTACEDLAKAKCRTYADNKNVEIACKINTNSNLAYPAIKQLSDSILNQFSKKIKINDLNVKIFTNKSPSYQHLDIKTAEKSYRKFMLKLIGTQHG